MIVTHSCWGISPSARASCISGAITYEEIADIFYHLYHRAYPAPEKTPLSEHNTTLIPWAQQPSAAFDRHVFFDWGSSSIRLVVVDISQPSWGDDVLTQEFFRATIPLPKDYTQEDLPARIAVWEQIRHAIELFFPSHHIEYHIIATAGLRSTPLGTILQDHLIQRRFPVRIISQEEEGQLSLKGIQYLKAHTHLHHLAAWDIGGKSMQITIGRHQKTHVLGNDAGLFHVMAYWRQKTHQTQFNHKEDLIHAQRIITELFDNQHLTNPPSPVKPIAPYDEFMPIWHHTYGVGPVHEYFILDYSQHILPEKMGIFNRDALEQMLLRLLDMDEKSILALKNPTALIHSKTELLMGFLLVLTTMQLLSMDTIEILRLDNREGMIENFLQNKKRNWTLF